MLRGHIKSAGYKGLIMWVLRVFSVPFYPTPSPRGQKWIHRVNFRLIKLKCCNIYITASTKLDSKVEKKIAKIVKMPTFTLMKLWGRKWHFITLFVRLKRYKVFFSDNVSLSRSSGGWGGGEALGRLQNRVKNDGMQLRFLTGRISYFSKVYGLLESRQVST